MKRYNYDDFEIVTSKGDYEIAKMTNPNTNRSLYYLFFTDRGVFTQRIGICISSFTAKKIIDKDFDEKIIYEVIKNLEFTRFGLSYAPSEKHGMSL